MGQLQNFQIFCKNFFIRSSQLYLEALDSLLLLCQLVQHAFLVLLELQLSSNEAAIQLFLSLQHPLYFIVLSSLL